MVLKSIGICIALFFTWGILFNEGQGMIQIPSEAGRMLIFFSFVGLAVALCVRTVRNEKYGRRTSSGR